MAQRIFIPVALAALVLAAPAMPASAEPLRVEAAGGRSTPLGLTVAQLRDATLYGETGEALGTIEEVLASRAGLVTALVVEMGHEILDIGEKKVLLRFDQVHRRGDRVLTQLSRAQLEAQPPWEE